MSEITNYYELVKPEFEKRFVHYEQVLDVLCTGYSDYEPGKGFGSNIILSGRGGFGKSQMSQLFAETVLKGKLEELFINSFGASSSDEAVWGEINLRELREGDRINYHLQDSFINHTIAILEEALDLPGRILDDMKDTISARCFRRGLKPFDMKTVCVVICTNQDPEVFRSKNRSSEAFLSRFPLDHIVEWPSYDAKSYRKMYERQLPGLIDLAPMFAQIVAGLSDGREGVSPREALDLMKLVVSRGRSRGRAVIVEDDFKILSYGTRFRQEADRIEGLVDDAMRECGAAVKLSGLRWEAEELIRRIEQTKEPGAMMSYMTKLEEVRDKIHALKNPGGDGSFESVLKLKKRISKALGDNRGEK